MTAPDRYGKRNVPKMIREWDAHRQACRAEGTPAIQATLDAMEEHIDYAYRATPADRVADLTEQLAAARRDAEEAEAYAAELEAKLARAVDALERLVALNDDYSPFGGELLQDRVDRTWKNARTTLAEIKGESHE